MTWRKLSHIEHLAELNIVCFARLEGTVTLEQLRSALTRVQRKHPALRALIRDRKDGLYYEADAAPEIPLRLVRRMAEDDYRRECQTELTTDFAYDNPQIRVVWLKSEREADLLFTVSHRICDGLSIFIIVKEVLQSLHSSEELVPYEAITTQDIIGNYEPPQPLKRKLAVSVLNGILRLVPSSRPAPKNKEHSLEWSAGRALSQSLRERCKAEGVSVHAAFLAALDRALIDLFGKRTPKRITCPIDLRRGRFPALKDDMLFYGGGNFKVRTGQFSYLDFWASARAINQDMRNGIEQEVLDIPGRLHFFESLLPLSSGQVQWILRITDALRSKRSRLKTFGVSNLGNVVIGDSGNSFHLKDLRLYAHSLNFRVLGLIPYTVNGEMRFYCMSSETCISRIEIEALKCEFMALLKQQVPQADYEPDEIPNTLAAVTAGRS
jgi:hypothetical protein